MANYPIITARQVGDFKSLLINIAENPAYLDNTECTYSDAMVNDLKSTLVTLESIFLNTLQGTVDGPNSDLTILIKETITDIKKVVSSTNASDAARVSASKFLFDLIQKDVEIRERLANIEKVVQLEALIKQFFSEHKDPVVAADFLKKLEALQ